MADPYEMMADQALDLLCTDADTLSAVPTELLLEARTAYSEERVHMRIEGELASDPELASWLDDCSQRIRRAIETELQRRMN